MKHEEITMQTKKAFAASLKKLMEKKPLSKITVSEIAQDCDVNRKTFYYHFEDIYDLLQWMLEQEAVEVVKQFDLMVDYEEAITFVLDYVGENRHILNCAYDSMGRDKLKDFFFRDFIDIMRSLLGSVEQQYGCKTDSAYKDFLCAFYTEGLVGMMIEWLQKKPETDRNKLMTYLVQTFRNSLPHLLAPEGKEEGEAGVNRFA